VSTIETYLCLRSAVALFAQDAGQARGQDGPGGEEANAVIAASPSLGEYATGKINPRCGWRRDPGPAEQRVAGRRDKLSELSRLGARLLLQQTPAQWEQLVPQNTAYQVRP
jgi:hypothetical protein